MQNYKKYLIALIAIAVLILGYFLSRSFIYQSPGPVSDRELSSITSDDGWQIYRDEKVGFEIKYPESWRVRTPDSYTGENFIVSFADPVNAGKPDTDDASTYVYLTISDGNPTLGGYYTKTNIGGREALETPWFDGLGGPLKNILFITDPKIFIGLTAKVPESKQVEMDMVQSIRFLK